MKIIGERLLSCDNNHFAFCMDTHFDHRKISIIKYLLYPSFYKELIRICCFVF